MFWHKWKNIFLVKLQYNMSFHYLTSPKDIRWFKSELLLCILFVWDFGCKWWQQIHFYTHDYHSNSWKCHLGNMENVYWHTGKLGASTPTKFHTSCFAGLWLAEFLIDQRYCQNIIQNVDISIDLNARLIWKTHFKHKI